MDRKFVERLVYLAFGQAFLIASAFSEHGDGFFLVLGGVAWTIAGVWTGRSVRQSPRS